MENIKSFTPVEFFNPNTEEWQNVETQQGNLLEIPSFTEIVKNIILLDDLIIVIWKEVDKDDLHIPSIYRGHLEFN